MAIEKMILLLLLYSQCSYARQVLNAAAEIQLENVASVVPEDDVYQHHRIALNTADTTMLHSLGLLTPLQIRNFMLYRKQLGKLLSIYEL